VDAFLGDASSRALGIAGLPIVKPLQSARRRVYDRPMPELTAFILAGGKSTRMGVDKVFVRLDGRTLLARALELARGSLLMFASLGMSRNSRNSVRWSKTYFRTVGLWAESR